MFLERLQIAHFRNIEACELELLPGFNLFYGGNAQGKSNLLEAVYALASLKGFRATRNSELIAFGQDAAIISASLDREGAKTRIDLQLNPRSRVGAIDGVPCSRLSDYLGVLRVILFVPADVYLLQAPPAQRRNFLDRMVFNMRPASLGDLEQYQRVSKMKLSLLRDLRVDKALLDVYDEQLVHFGTRILVARSQYLEKLAPFVSEAFGAIFGDSLSCRLSYRSTALKDAIHYDGSPTPTEADFRAGLTESIERSRTRDMATHAISKGPQRDDWGLSLDGHEARQFSSQGQQRSLVLALKLAEIACLKALTRLEPVFLLDDVSSELDPTRNARLLEHLNAVTAQVLLTTTSRSHFALPAGTGIFNVENGKIRYEGV